MLSAFLLQINKWHPFYLHFCCTHDDTGAQQHCWSRLVAAAYRHLLLTTNWRQWRHGLPSCAVTLTWNDKRFRSELRCRHRNIQQMKIRRLITRFMTSPLRAGNMISYMPYDCRCGWQEGQFALFKLALNPEPLVQHVLLSAWGGILRYTQPTSTPCHGPL